MKVATARPRLAAIKKLAKGSSVFWTCGCATGFFMEAAAEEGFDVRGVEFSTVAISKARPDIRERMTCGDVNALLAKEPEKFDVVTAFDIIEHVQDPANFSQGNPRDPAARRCARRSARPTPDTFCAT